MGVNQFGELGEDFHHLVGTLTTGSNDYDIGLGLLGDGVLQHRLTCTEGTGDKSRSALYDGVDRINDTHTRFEQFEGARLLHIVGHGSLHRPFLNHIHLHLVTLCIGQHGNGIFNLIVALCGYLLHGADSLLLEGHHDFQGLEVLIHLAEPVRGHHLVAHLGQRYEMPYALLIQRIGVLSSLQEYPLHLIQVVLQSVVILREHTGSQSDLKHVARKFGFSTYLQSARAFKYLNVHVLTYHFNHLRHQPVATRRDVADLVLCHRAIYSEGYHIGYNTTNSSFCCHILM